MTHNIKGKQTKMLNKLKEMRESREEGFTLIELLVVIVIIGVLAAIALPIFLNQQKAAAAAAVKSEVTAVTTALVKKPTDSTLIGPAVTASPKSDNVTLVTAGSIDAAGALTGAAAWNGYVVKGTTSADSTFWYAFSSATGKYTQN
jgi:type IV pilus assembly protein PilA